MAEVRLTVEEKGLAMDQAARLMHLAFSRGIPNQHGFQPDQGRDLEVRTMHSAAVLLARKAFNIPLPFAREINLDAPDILPDIKVYWTPNQNGGLIVRQSTNRFLKLLLVTGPDMESLKIRGWSWAADVLRNGFLLQKPNRPDCWVLIQRHLNPIHTIHGGNDV